MFFHDTLKEAESFVLPYSLLIITKFNMDIFNENMYFIGKI